MNTCIRIETYGRLYRMSPVHRTWFLTSLTVSNGILTETQLQNTDT